MGSTASVPRDKAGVIVTQSLQVLPAVLCLLVPVLPLLAVGAMALSPSTAWHHVQTTVLGDYVTNTIFLVTVGGGLALATGTATAWLVSALDFPGRGLVSWMLVLPFALPPYIAAYAWGDVLDVRGLPVATLVFATTLYPYAYLTARAGFAAQSVCALEAARSLGAGPVVRLFSVALPLARASIVAGGALIGLEIMADYGAADYLGVPTLAVGVFRTWFSMGDLAGAARLALAALSVALVLMWVEQSARKGMTAGGSNRWRTASATPAGPVAGLAYLLFCLLPVLLGLVVPVAHLVGIGLEAGPPLRNLVEPAVATALIAATGAVATLLVALIAASLRGGSHTWLAAPARLCLMAGYATPGAVLALGVLAVLALAGAGAAASLAGTAGLVVLVVAYAARFGGAAFEPIDAGLAKATGSLRSAAASLGAGRFARFSLVEAPVALPGIIAAGLIVAVEIAKELPATLILRPFGFDTLAVRAHAYAADERLEAAAWPALIIVLLALVPTLLMTRAIAAARAGAASQQEA